MSVPLAVLERHRIGGTPNTVFKSGPLFISSKGIGWKSWKKRWFILTRTSLVFFKNDPSALPQKGGEVNLTLGGIDLNNSGSVIVREDKKLLTVLFPDGRDGRAFTLKAESSEDLYEWKTALELALAQAPNAALVMGHNGIFHDTNDSTEGSFHQWKDKRLVKSMVVRRPILLALEDIDGAPSFLEKALRFLEKHGTKVEGILRQSADVEEVEHRVKEYEQGKDEFGSDEDAHVIADCVKHVLRELPSSPVPASCCTALLEAYRIDRKEARVNSMRSAILETFPEPNRRLLQRILKMMHAISSHASENRMASSAVAACMAPLLLRPLLAGECELEDNFDMNGDNSAQLLAAANAANNAQTIITTLLDEYENIFDDNGPHSYSISAGSRIENSASEDSTDDENLNMKDNGFHVGENRADLEIDDGPERALSGKSSESSCCIASDLYDYKAFGVDDLDAESHGNSLVSAMNSNLSIDPQPVTDSNALFTEVHAKSKQRGENEINEMSNSTRSPNGESHRSMGEILASIEPGNSFPGSGPESCAEKLMGSKNMSAKRSPFWGKSSTRKTLSMESVDSSGEEELAIQRLESTKNDLRQRIAKEARGNAILQASLERRKQALHERRLALEQDVERLQEQLQAERDLRAALEVGLSISSGQFCSARGMDSKTMAELEEIALAEADVARLKQKVAELHQQLNQQRQHQYGSLADPFQRLQHFPNQNPPQKFLQPDFDTNLAYCDHERKQRTESLLLGADWRSSKAQVLASGSSGRPATRRHYIDTTLSDPRSFDMSVPMDEFCAVDSASMPSNLRSVEVVDYPGHHPSSTIVELTTRLDFFKERRSQLMEQLHNLDLSYGSVQPQDFVYKQPSPPWN